MRFFILVPRLSKVKIDGDEDQMSKMEKVTSKGSKAFWMGLLAMVLGFVGLFLWAMPENSALRGPDMVDPEIQSLT